MTTRRTTITGFNKSNIMTAVAACEAARNRYGFNYRVEADFTITTREPGYRVDAVLKDYNDRNTAS